MTGRKELWELVEQGRQNRAAVERRIGEMSEQELVDLYWTHEQVVADLKDDSLTAHLDRPLSEDTLDDIARWVVGQGLDHYEDVMAEDVALPGRVPSGEAVPFWGGEITKVYHDRYGIPVRFKEDPPPAKAR